MTSTPRFEALIERYHDEIYTYLWRLLGGNADEAEDLTQETFLRAYQAFSRLRPNSNYRAWLYKIATNSAYSAFRRWKREREAGYSDFADVEEYEAPDDAVERLDDLVIQQETLEAIKEAINALPPKQRTAVLLRYLQGLDYSEIAQVLDCSEDSARANVYQALRRLRQAVASRHLA